MAINLSDNILAKTTAPADAKYGPYYGADLTAAKAAATSYLQSSFRYEGLTVGLIVGTDEIVEYWFKGGVTDNDLILKTGGGGGSVEVQSQGTQVVAEADNIDFDSGIKAEVIAGTDGVKVDTVFNTSIGDSVVSVSVGGLDETAASVLKTKTMVELMNDILFPTQLPTYILPTVSNSVSGFASTANSGGNEIGSPVTYVQKVLGTKNDCGDVTDVALLSNLNGAGFTTTLSGAGDEVSLANMPGPFPGVDNINNPNFRQELEETVEDYIIPAPTSGTRSVFQFKSTTTTTNGLKKNDNKGDADTRAFGSTVNNPQEGRTLTSGVSTKYGYWPYYWGKSASEQSADQVVALLEAGTYVGKQVRNSVGTLVMDFTADGEWPWFAIPEGFNDKTEWFVSASNFGDIGATPTDLFAAGEIREVESHLGYWTKNYKIYVAQKVTTIGSAEIRE